MQYTTDRHYVVYHDNGAFGAFTGRTWYDAFDCAHCGSQTLVGVREMGEPISLVDEGVKKQNETD